MPEVVENLDPNEWDVAERQAVVNACIAAGGVVLPGQSIDLSAMTDTELDQHITAVSAEASQRGQATGTVSQFQGHTIVSI